MPPKTLVTLATLALFPAALLVPGNAARAEDLDAQSDTTSAPEASLAPDDSSALPPADSASPGHDPFELELQASSSLSLRVMTGVRPIPPLVFLAGLEWRRFEEDHPRGLGGLGGLAASNETNTLSVPMAIKLYLGGGGHGVQPLLRLTGALALDLGELDRTAWSVGAGGGVACLFTDDFGMSAELYARYEQSRLHLPGLPTIEAEWVTVGVQMTLFARL